MNGGPETANLKPDQAAALSIQKRYKLELQAEISKLREKYSAVKKHPTPAGNHAPTASDNKQAKLNETTAGLEDNKSVV